MCYKMEFGVNINLYFKYLVHGNITHDGDIEVKYQVQTKQ
jgi:hypothetical protein